MLTKERADMLRKIADGSGKTLAYQLIGIADEIESDIDAAEADLHALREALRRRVIKDGAIINGRVFPCWCVECSRTWDPGSPESHAEGCLVAPIEVTKV